MATDTERERRFWDRYIRLLNDQGIGPPYDRWHVIWAERYIRAFPELRLAAHTAETVTSFLESLGQRATLKDWWYRQAVVAIQNLFSIVKPEWCQGFDWNFWLASAKPIEHAHPTVAREPEPASHLPPPEPGFEARCVSLAAENRELFSRVTAALRVRGMSVRTEKACLHWLCHFMLHYGGRSPLDMGGPEVAAFLQHLAVNRNDVSFKSMRFRPSPQPLSRRERGLRRCPGGEETLYDIAFFTGCKISCDEVPETRVGHEKRWPT